MAGALRACGQRQENLPAGLGYGRPWTHSCTRREWQREAGTENRGGAHRPRPLNPRRVVAGGGRVAATLAATK